MTAPEWRDCADPDELAAAVAAGVEVEVQRRVGQPWQPTRSIDAAQFAGFISTGHRYRLPTSWRPEPPALAVLPTPPPVPPNPMAVREFAAKVADYVSTHQNADGMSKRGWAIEAVVQALEEPTASQEARSILAPTPPWPGAVLSGLTDEDGVPTWLAQAGQVRGEQARACTSVPWLPNTSYGEDEWVEVRAPRAVPAAPVTVTIPAETAHALLRYIEDGDYDTDYVIDRLADLLIAAMDGDQ